MCFLFSEQNLVICMRNPALHIFQLGCSSSLKAWRCSTCHCSRWAGGWHCFPPLETWQASLGSPDHYAYLNQPLTLLVLRTGGALGRCRRPGQQLPADPAAVAGERARSRAPPTACASGAWTWGGSGLPPEPVAWAPPAPTEKQVRPGM